MTARMALIGALAGVALATLGLFLALGPWALFGAGVAIAAGFLLLPTADPDLPERGEQGGR